MSVDSTSLYDQYLKDGNVMQLATMSEDKPWICTVYYVARNGRLYWLSYPTRRHSVELATRPLAAAAIMIKPTQPVIGVQVEGNVTVVTDAETVKNVMTLYHAKYQQGGDFYDSYTKGTNKHQLYCLEVTQANIFDEMNYPDDGRQSIKLDFSPNFRKERSA